MAAASLLHVQPAVVVLDLDGTTLDADHKLAPATLAALRRDEQQQLHHRVVDRRPADKRHRPQNQAVETRGTGRRIKQFSKTQYSSYVGSLFEGLIYFWTLEPIG